MFDSEQLLDSTFRGLMRRPKSMKEDPTVGHTGFRRKQVEDTRNITVKGSNGL